MQNCKVDFDALPWQSTQKGARFKNHQAGNHKLRLLEFTREFIESDWCRKGHLGVILEGELDINFDGEVVHFKAGDGLSIPEGEADKHKAIILTKIVKMILVEDA